MSELVVNAFNRELTYRNMVPGDGRTFRCLLNHPLLSPPQRWIGVLGKECLGIHGKKNDQIPGGSGTRVS